MCRIHYLLTSLVLLLTLAASAITAPAGPDTSMQAQIHAAVSRGLGWIERHPASIEDGGLPDLLDEGVGFMMLSVLSADPASREHFAALFRKRMSALDGMPEFARWATAGQKRLTDYYHLVLAAHLMQQAGSPTDMQPIIVARAQQVLMFSPYCDPTKRLTIALFLQHLDEDPGISIEGALAASRIERIARGTHPPLPETSADSQQRLAASLHLYALVHEIVALTDFGRQPIPQWLEERLQPLNRYLLEAITWTGRTGNVDLLSELLMSARFIETPLQEVLPETLQLLLDSQQEDGSWGSYETRRPNKRRHAVFTATTALWSYAGSVTGPEGE
jgi:hypothetical protein